MWIPGVNLDNIAVFHCSAQACIYILKKVPSPPGIICHSGLDTV